MIGSSFGKQGRETRISLAGEAVLVGDGSPEYWLRGAPGVVTKEKNGNVYVEFDSPERHGEGKWLLPEELMVL